MDKKLVKKLKKKKSPTTALILAVLFNFWSFLYLEEYKKFWTWFIILLVLSSLSIYFVIFRWPTFILSCVVWGLATHDAIELE